MTLVIECSVRIRTASNEGADLVEVGRTRSIPLLYFEHGFIAEPTAELVSDEVAGAATAAVELMDEVREEMLGNVARFVEQVRTGLRGDG